MCIKIDVQDRKLLSISANCYHKCSTLLSHCCWMLEIISLLSFSFLIMVFLLLLFFFLEKDGLFIMILFIIFLKLFTNLLETRGGSNIRPFRQWLRPQMEEHPLIVLKKINTKGQILFFNACIAYKIFNQQYILHLRLQK